MAARLVRFEAVQEEAAIDLGASRFQTLRRIILPQLTPSLCAAAIFAFSWSFNNFEIDFFVGGYDETFPVWVYSDAAARAQPADRERDLDGDLGSCRCCWCSSPGLSLISGPTAVTRGDLSRGGRRAG